MTNQQTVLPHLSRSRSALRRSTNHADRSTEQRHSMTSGSHDFAIAESVRGNERTLSRQIHRSLVWVAEKTLVVLVSLAALPLMLSIATLVLIFDGRPIFYRQDRVGKGGRIFRIWKFRTMRKDAESKTGPVWCTTCDERITKLGRYLRASHLDELPQLFNILQGSMKFVGPRPERPEFVEQLANEVPGYMQRLRVHPGVTGVAQIRQGYDQSISDVRRKVAMDIWYIRRASFSLDLLIIAATVPHMIGELWGHAKSVLRRQVKPQTPVMTYDVLRQQVEESTAEVLAQSVGQPHVKPNGASRTSAAREQSQDRIRNRSA